MKTKTINAVLTKKINDWLDSITDDEVRKIAKANVIVTGGSITSMLLKEEINDYDLYFKTKEAVLALARYYCNQFNQNRSEKLNHIGYKFNAYVLDGADIEKWKKGKMTLSEATNGEYKDIPYQQYCEWENSDNQDQITTRGFISGMIMNISEDRVKIIIRSDGVAEDQDEIADNVDYDVDKYIEAISDGDEIPANVEVDKKAKYKPIFLSTNAITLSNKVQLVIRFYGDVDEIHKNYDFVHANNYWTFKTGVVTNSKALESILARELYYVGSKYPVASIVRMRKFIKRGWSINAGQILKIAFQISELDLKNIYVLEDQLVGVDSLYFIAFIDKMKKMMADDKNFSLSSDYLTTVIDKIFG